MKTIVYFEPYSEGHRTDQLFFFAKYLLEHAHDFRFLIVASTIEERLKTLCQTNGNTTIIPFNATQLSRNLFEKSNTEYIWIRKIIKRYSPDCLIFNAVDWVLWSLFFRPFKKNILIGIFYRFKGHYPAMFHCDIGGIKSVLIEKVKLFLIRYALRNNKVNTIFSYDPYAVAFVNNGRMRWIPDPYTALSVNANEINQDTDPDVLKCLTFGYIDERKGVFQLLEALSQMNITKGFIELTIAGKIQESLKKRLLSKIESINQKHGSNITICIDDRFVPIEELQNYVKKTHLIVIPYQKFPGSSGVLMWASAFYKPVLTQDYGYIGALVNEYSLGFAIDTTDPFVILEKITQLHHDRSLLQINKSKVDRFLKDRSPENFAKEIFDRCFNE